jgi:hypothetical protein
MGKEFDLSKKDVYRYSCDGGFEIVNTGDSIKIVFDTGSVIDMNGSYLKKWEHDCDNCIYLGRYEEYKEGVNKVLNSEGKKIGQNPSQIYDLYYCEKGSLIGHTVLARYGNKGHEYYSWSPDTDCDIEAIQEAIKRVKQYGFFK